MPARVIIGRRSDINQVGMWVSRPGRSAYSSDPSDLLIDTGRIPQSPIIAGAIVNPVLSADTNNFRAPTPSSTAQVPVILSKNVSGETVYNVGGATYTDHTGLPNSDGVALFYKDYFFKSDQTPLLASGKIPLMHVSIGDPNVGTGSATVGDNYPKVYVYDNKIRLAVYQNWDATIAVNWYRITSEIQYYPSTTRINNLLYWTGGTAGEAGNVQIRSMYVGPTPPNTLPTNCVINYAVYNIEMVLP